MPAHRDPVIACAISPDGKVIATTAQGPFGGGTNLIRLWDMAVLKPGWAPLPQPVVPPSSAAESKPDTAPSEPMEPPTETPALAPRASGQGDAVAHTAMRTWTDATGAYTVEAEFIGFSDGVVQLRRFDGGTIALPLEKLSLADQHWIREKAGPTD